MMQLLTKNPIMFLVIAATFIVITVFILYRSYKKQGLDGIREDVYKLFVLAEKVFSEPGCGTQKFEFVIRIARTLLPKPLSILISDQQLRTIIQFWFDEAKDLLDDGKRNNSEKGIK